MGRKGHEGEGEGEDEGEGEEEKVESSKSYLRSHPSWDCR